MAVRNIATRIEEYNKGRDPLLLPRKYRAMGTDQFRFLRGTCHLFYEDWPRDVPLNAAPPVWSSGDLHLENFGSYKGQNRIAYFDISDFDEAVLAPCTWDVARLSTSILVAARSLKLDAQQALSLCQCYLDAYAEALSAGHPRMLDRADATGMVRDLLTSLRKRDRAAFLDKRTVSKKGRRRLLVDGIRATAVTGEERARIDAWMKGWAAEQPNPRFWKLIDVAHRIAGTGSLGTPRYVLLIEGRGSPDENFLLDLKAAGPSALLPYVTCAQPAWSSDAERVAAIQERMQGIPPAILRPVMIEGKPFVLRELLPTQDRVSLASWNGKIRRLTRVLSIMGRVTAWDQLRSGGRQGSATADELIAFAREPRWKAEVIEVARAYTAQVEADHRELCASPPGSHD